MKRQYIGLDDLADRGNLLWATAKAAQGKGTRPAVQRFLANLDANLNRMTESILAETAPTGQSTRFVIHDPKLRVIHAACFADRVLHHAILNLAESRFETMLLPSCFACRLGKGVHRAVAAVQIGLRTRPWFVQGDVDAYFPSIRHDLLFELLTRRFKGEGFLRLLGRILAAGATAGAGRGLPIGALTSQHFANAFLDSADRLILAQPGCGSHVRYMDDFFWSCSSREAAEESLAALDAHLKARGLRLKSGARIARTSEGTRFCGFRVRQGAILPGQRKLARYRAAMARIDGILAAGECSGLEAQRAHDSALAALAGSHSLGFRRRVLTESPGTITRYSESQGCPSI